MKLLIRGLAPLVLLFVAVGCSRDGRVQVKGTITVAGKGPLPGGTIQFVSVADPTRIGTGQIRHDGTYEVPDAPVGECKVVIDNAHLDTASGMKSNPTGMKAGPPMGMKGAPGMPSGPPGGGPMGKGPPADATKKMSGPPKEAEIPGDMSATQEDSKARKYVKLDSSYTKTETTPLKADVKTNSTTFDFEVK